MCDSMQHKHFITFGHLDSRLVDSAFAVDIYQKFQTVYWILWSSNKIPFETCDYIHEKDLLFGSVRQCKVVWLMGHPLPHRNISLKLYGVGFFVGVVLLFLFWEESIGKTTENIAVVSCQWLWLSVNMKMLIVYLDTQFTQSRLNKKTALLKTSLNLTTLPFLLTLPHFLSYLPALSSCGYH